MPDATANHVDIDRAYRDYVQALDPVNKLCLINFTMDLSSPVSGLSKENIIAGYREMADINLRYCTECENVANSQTSRQLCVNQKE